MTKLTEMVTVKNVGYAGLEDDEYDKTVEIKKSEFKKLLTEQLKDNYYLGNEAKRDEFIDDIIKQATPDTTIIKVVDDKLSVDLVGLFDTLEELNDMTKKIFSVHAGCGEWLFWQTDNEYTRAFYDVLSWMGIHTGSCIFKNDETGMPYLDCESEIKAILGYSDEDIPYQWELNEDDEDYKEQEDEAYDKWKDVSSVVYDCIKEYTYATEDILDGLANIAKKVEKELDELDEDEE